MPDIRKSTDPQSWADFLKQQKLPVDGEAARAASEACADPSVSYQRLSELINRDPIISYYVMATAETAKSNLGEESKTLANAISMLGTDRVSDIIQSLPERDGSAANVRQRWLDRSLQASFFAAELARCICREKEWSGEEDFFWSGLLYGLPQWLLWQYATSVMRLIHYQVRHRRNTQTAIEKACLGCTVREIASELSQHIYLPEYVRNGLAEPPVASPQQWVALSRLAPEYGKTPVFDDRQLKHLITVPSFTVLLSNAIAQSSMYDWYSFRTERFQRVLATVLGSSLNRAVLLTHEAAVTAAGRNAFPRVMPLAARLFLPAKTPLRMPFARTARAIPTRDSIAAQAGRRQAANDTPVAAKKIAPGGVDIVYQQQPHRKPAASDNPVRPASAKPAAPQPVHSAAQQAVLPVRHRNTKLLNEFSERLLENSSSFADIHEMMNGILEAINKGLGLNRVSISLINTQRTRIKTYYSQGMDNYPVLKNLQVDLTQPSLFRRLTEKPSSIWIKPESSPKIWALVPVELRANDLVKEAFLMSLFVNQKPVAVVMTDDPQGPHLTDAEYKQFKQLCSAGTTCLQRMALGKN